ncbi:NAD-P-binding protein [Mycena albidolilacea]|uniref:NAD-P-binding protein n=1 Tax=Mycena albidolilacea TaxID=1033008 RepID=A0AAD7ER19_9AGAR|nr:NAD-P-binding protein [Mycena albidolilacea]
MSAFDINSTGESVGKVFADKIKGKTVIVTGVSPGGFGADTARVLALYGAKVVLAGRSLSKIKATADAIKKEVLAADLKELVLDLSSQKAVRKAAEEVLKYSGPIDVVITNAGVMGTPYEKTVDGLELQFASNHVGHFLFVSLIMPKLLESSAPRVVLSSSVGHFWGPVRFDDYGFEDGKSYDKWLAYGQSKTAVILHGVELAERYKGKLVVFSVHPGGAITNLFSSMTKEDYEKFSDFYNLDGTPKGDWARSIGQGTATYFVAAFDPSITDHSGGYLSDCKLATEQAAPHATDKETAKKLWELSEKLVGQKFDV